MNYPLVEFIKRSAMRVLFILTLMCSVSSGWAQLRQTANEEPPGGIAREDLPLAVIWGLSIYGGATIPFSPDAFSEFWKVGPNVTLDMDILLRNDTVLGFCYSYSYLKFNAQEFWLRQGTENSDNLSKDFDIPISSLLFSYRGQENYLLQSYKPVYEIGGGFYHIQNTDVDLIYTSDYEYAVSPTDRIEVGLFGGLGVAWLLTDTLQMSIKGRYHYVFKVTEQHQYFDVRLGLSLL